MIQGRQQRRCDEVSGQQHNRVLLVHGQIIHSCEEPGPVVELIDVVDKDHSETTKVQVITRQRVLSFQQSGLHGFDLSTLQRLTGYADSLKQQPQQS